MFDENMSHMSHVTKCEKWSSKVLQRAGNGQKKMERMMKKQSRHGRWTMGQE
jgi:hypothetical protein